MFAPSADQRGCVSLAGFCVSRRGLGVVRIPGEEHPEEELRVQVRDLRRLAGPFHDVVGVDEEGLVGKKSRVRLKLHLPVSEIDDPHRRLQELVAEMHHSVGPGDPRGWPVEEHGQVERIEAGTDPWDEVGPGDSFPAEV